MHERRFVTWTKVGVPIEIVQLILGHSSPTVTRRIYAHVMKKATAEQVDTASQLITKHRRDQSVTKPTAARRAQSQPFKEQQVRAMITSGQGRGRTADLPIPFTAGQVVRRVPFTKINRPLTCGFTVARGGVEPPTFRFSADGPFGGCTAATCGVERFGAISGCSWALDGHG
jgi:hypothetical protein